MLVLVLFIIVTAVGVFVFIFKKEGGKDPSAVKEDARLQDFPSAQTPLPEKPVQISPPKPAESASNEPEEPFGFKDELVQKLDQRCAKLEQLLEEKNRIIARLDGELGHEQNHHQEVDSVKEVLHQEIEELKLQNQQLKDEMSKILEENRTLQSRVSGLEKILGGQKNAPFVEQGASAMEPTQRVSLTLSGGSDIRTGGRSAEGGLTLRDVFGDETKP